MSELFCKVSVNDVPDPNISGLEPSERIVSIYTHLQDFFPHLKRVYEQQTDLQSPTSPLLTDLNRVRASSRSLAALVNSFYQSLFPNLPMPEPAGGPTTLPPPQNVFQQKVYGCVVLKTYLKLLSNVTRELRTLKNKVCRRRIQINSLFWGWPKAGLRQFFNSTYPQWVDEDYKRYKWVVWRWRVHQCNEAYLWYLLFIFLFLIRGMLLKSKCEGIYASYVYLICLICYVRFYFADVNLFAVYRIIKGYFAAVLLLWSFISQCGCINNVQFQQHGSVWKNSKIDFHTLHASSSLLDSACITIYLFLHCLTKIVSAKKCK